MSAPLSPFQGPKAFSVKTSGPVVIPYAVRLPRDPTVADRNYPIGSTWANIADERYFGLVSIAGGEARWAPLGDHPLGDVKGLLGDSGQALPSSGDVTIAGGDNITTAASGSTLTVSLDAALTIDSATLEDGDLVVEDGNVQIDQGNLLITLGDATLTDGNLLLSEGDLTLADGNLLLTQGDATLTQGDLNLTDGNVLLSEGDLTLTDGNIAVTLGDVTLSQGNLGLTLGNLTLADGDLSLEGDLNITKDGGKILAVAASVAAAGDSAFGSVALVGGTATVDTTAITADSLVFVSVQALGTVGVAQAIGVTARVAGTSFTLTSADGTDTSTVAWMIVN